MSSSLELLMLDHCPEMMLLVEPRDLRILMSNRAARQALGYSEDALMAMSITDIESSLQDVFYWEDVRSGQYQDIDKQEGLYQCADNSMLSVIKTVRVVDYENASLLVVLAKNIRDERQVEDVLERTLSQLRATLESTGNGILVIDWQGSIASMNRQFSAMWSIPEALLLERNEAAIFESMIAQVVESETCRVRLQAVVDRIESEEIFQLKDGRVFECRSR